LHIDEEGIHFVDRFKERTFLFQDMERIKVSKFRNPRLNNKAFQLINIKLKNRRRPLIIRPYDYENQTELLNRFQEMVSKIKSTNV
jgi:hypothetical protein